MKNYIVKDPWKIIEDRFESELNPNSESLFSIGNGRMGQRANFPEKYSGESLRGSYVAGVYYPDKTRVGWWKNGYPEYFAKVLNSVNWIGVKVKINNEELDLAKVQFKKFYRELDMKEGILRRTCTVITPNNQQISIKTERFYSLKDKDLCYLKYEISTEKDDVQLELTPYLDFNVTNADSNYDEDFWKDRAQKSKKDCSWVKATTKKTEFDVCAAMKTELSEDYNEEEYKTSISEGLVQHRYSFKLEKGKPVVLTKYVAITSTFYYDKKELSNKALKKCGKSAQKGYDKAQMSQIRAWRSHWNNCDIKIGGDISAQQGIRFNIFQLMQTYSGNDARLNIGPKGFTGEKYGGSTYWDTEAYCLPFYMSTAPISVARNLLVYRHNHLQKAIENAKLLGFKNGAALYPMVTMNGEECHNEWEITFEEIHRNGAIAYAIYDYIQYTGDTGYLSEYGLDVLVGIARFWAQRVNLSPEKNKYVMLGVTGPNEYENNVNNNFYTNYLASWCLSYAAECLDHVRTANPDRYTAITTALKFTDGEQSKWIEIAQNMYYPEDKSKGIYLQQDGFLDKEDLTVADLRPEDRPINQKWSWDRILRSPFIKQADVLQGIYFFEDDFDIESIRRNFDYYEPKTVHESSLSPCVHSILAAKLGKEEKAYEMYVRTARLDLDDYNNDTEDGCHITSMAGTWLSIVKGFAGMRVKNSHLSFNPFIPKQWSSYAFKILFQGKKIQLYVTKKVIELTNYSETPIEITVNGSKQQVEAHGHISIPHPV